MTVQQASAAPKDVIIFAKKHRISVHDAARILEQFANDRKSADKAARRIAA
ncbi:hypothetical protein [Pararhizobium sp.]|uniref:hypothetical protein n=1 Tax=Pararhizobium sp. TaxID=1977563 RepID=UPI0027163BD6|nr:hypothetical protein [Pararhizobium sp.]MDO9415557.1 hypothetical protein [Pararhizobium sp.]